MLTNSRKEKISAFLDNDMHHDELMSFSLSAESDDARAAQRYQMIGDTLRGEMSNSSFVDVSHAVREALADEISAVETGPSLDKQAPSAIFDISAWFRPVAGMAVAASVAVVMVVTLSGQETGALTPIAVNVEEQPAAMSATKVATDDQLMDKKATDLDPYINQHLEFATQDALQGRLPYVRAVSYETEK